MALSIVHGPPNSGRAGVIRERFTSALGRDPVLVVPTYDDVVAFSGELCSAGSSLLGGIVTTFDGLFREVAESTGVAAPAELTRAQRLRLFAAAASRAKLRILRSSAARAGFAPALAELVTELQASEISPAGLTGGADELGGSALLAEIAGVYSAYLMLRDGAGRGDPHHSAALAITALRTDPGSWRGRPVIVYGFDDLTRQQLSLLQTLAPLTEVTAAVTFENRESLAARSELIARLRDSADHDAGGDRATEPDAANTASPLLFALERGFLDKDADRVPADQSLRFERCASDRAEAEAVGGAIARLLADGAEPGEIAIAVRDVHSRGPMIGRVLESYGIPVATEADQPLGQTATGASLAGLLRAAAPGGTAADLLAYLSAPGRARGAFAEDLERRVRRQAIVSVEAAEDLWAEMGGSGLDDLRRLREAGSDRRAALAVVAEAALDISQWPIKKGKRQGALAEADEAIELRAGAAIADALGEIAELDDCLPTAAELATLIEGMSMRLWSGPATGRVRIASPYGLRAARFDHVFVISLQDGEFPSHRSGGPFLSDEQRAASGLRQRSDSEAEERYLFHVCLSLPRKTLHLSHRYCDDDGKTISPSPYLDDVAALLAPGADDAPGATGAEVMAARQRTRSLADVVFRPADAPSLTELTRSLAAQERKAVPPGLGLSAAMAAPIAAALTEAAAYEPAPGPVVSPLVLGALGEHQTYGASTLEGYATCSYRWFVDHELNPRAMDPDGDQLAYGSAIHMALERLYADPPTEGTRPSLATVEAWIEAGGAHLEITLGEVSPSSSAAARIGRRRIHDLLEAFLRRDARRTDPFETQDLEARFGLDEDGTAGLDLDGWRLRGSIDRVDVDPVRGLALIHDYKIGNKVPMQSSFKRKRRLQLSLYMLAVERLLGKQPVAGVYHPLGIGMRAVPRGMGRKDERDETLDGLGLPKNDWVDEDTYTKRLREAEELAGEIVGGMRSGRIDRDPLEGKCPPFCTFAPICRLDRRADTGGEQPVRSEVTE